MLNKPPSLNIVNTETKLRHWNIRMLYDNLNTRIQSSKCGLCVLCYSGSIIADYIIIRADTASAADVLTNATMGLVEGKTLTFEGQEYIVANVTIDDIVCKYTILLLISCGCGICILVLLYIQLTQHSSIYVFRVNNVTL